MMSRRLSVPACALALAVAGVWGAERSHAAAHSQAAAPATRMVIGDRVELQIGDIWYRGVVFAAQGDQFSVNRDGFGRTRYEVGAIRREQKPVAMRLVVAAWGADPRYFYNGTPVQVESRGVTYRGNIGGHVEGSDTYLVDRYATTPGTAAAPEEVLTSSIRVLEAVPAPRPDAAPAPPNVTTGTYLCVTSEGRDSTTVGRLRILDGGTFSGVTPDGSGPQRRYSYNPATGEVTFVGGIANFPATVLAGGYRSTNNGGSEIRVYYARPGSQRTLAMDCSLQLR